MFVKEQQKKDLMFSEFYFYERRKVTSSKCFLCHSSFFSAPVTFFNGLYRHKCLVQRPVIPYISCGIVVYIVSIGLIVMTNPIVICQYTRWRTMAKITWMFYVVGVKQQLCDTVVE
jgi:hypothetical protein